MAIRCIASPAIRCVALVLRALIVSLTTDLQFFPCDSQLLKNYSRSRGLKTAITVGIVGYPNVGKSSLINSLKRCGRART